MRFTKAPANTFKNLVMNAGVILSKFDLAEGAVNLEDILAATSGGSTFQATPEFSDKGEGIDNVPLNMLELKKLEQWIATLTGTWRTTTAGNVAFSLGAADVSGDKVTPRQDLKTTDFKDAWLVADYSEYNGETKGGYAAVRLINALSTGGFQLKTNDKGNGDMAFTLTGHYTMANQTQVPFEVYIHEGAPED